jgi:hypothetical protein
VVLSTFDQENHDRILKEDSLEKGKELGKKIGKEEMNQLILHLKKDNRIDDLIRSATDAEFQEKLLKEYNIN